MIILVEDVKHPDALKEADIFYQKDFFNLHAQPSGTYCLGLANGAPEHLIGVAQVAIDASHVSTPIRGTYGGIYLSPRIFSLEKAEEAIQLVENWLLQKGMKSFDIVLPPFFLSTHIQTWFNILLRRGFNIKSCDLNYAIAINDQPYEQRVNYACLKKLKKIAAAQLDVRELNLAEFEAGHALICQSRERKGRRFSMDWPSIQNMQQAFPHAFKMAGVFEENELRAAGIFIQITAETTYVFAWGDDGVLNQLTPTSLLAKYLYEYCQQQKFKFLDLGISTEAGVPNLGLINYKLSLGAEESLKFTMTKQYE